MQLLSLIVGVAAILIFLLAAIPLLYWMNWPNIPVAIAGIVLGIMGMLLHVPKKAGIAGVILCVVVLLLIILRLRLGVF